MHPLTSFDDVFLVLAAGLMIWARFAALRARQRLRREIARLRAASAACQRDGGDLRMIAEIAARLHHVERATRDLSPDGRRRLRVHLRGKTGKLDLVDNFFLRNRRIAAEIDLWLAEMERISRRAILADLRAYRSPLNLFNFPSSLLRFFDVDPRARVEYALDAVSWALLVAIAIWITRTA